MLVGPRTLFRDLAVNAASSHLKKDTRDEQTHITASVSSTEQGLIVHRPAPLRGHIKNTYFSRQTFVGSTRLQKSKLLVTLIIKKLKREHSS